MAGSMKFSVINKKEMSIMRIKLDNKVYRVLNGFDTAFCKYAVSDDTGVCLFFGLEDVAMDYFYSNNSPSCFYYKSSLGYWWDTTNDKAVNFSIFSED